MGSTDNFLPGKVKAVFEAVACSAAAVPDNEPEEVGVSGSETPTLVGAAEDALYTSEV